MNALGKLRSWTANLSGYFVYLLLTATIGPFLFGYHLAELNAPQDVISCAKKSINLSSASASASSIDSLPQCIPMDATQIGLVSSIFTLGGLLGALAAGPISAKHGRLLPMRITTAFFAAGPVAEALAPNIAVLAIGRLISGVGAGAALVLVPIYVSEISPPKERGLFGAFSQIMTNTGIFLTQVLGYFFSHDSMWRLILAVGGLIGLVQLLGLFFAIDSPKWTAETGHVQTAKIDLRRIRGKSAAIEEEITGWNVYKSGVDDVDADEERETLLYDESHNTTTPATSSSNPNQTNRQPTISIMQCLTTAPYRRATLTIMMVMLAQQLTGINSIVMYGVNLLSDLLASNSSLLNIAVSLLNVIVTAACAPLADTLGRKKSLLLSISIMGVSSVLLGIGIRFSFKILSAVAVLTFVSGFAVGTGPIPFILAAELVGPEAVGAAQSWGLAANWTSTFIVAQFFPVVNQYLGKGLVYFVFAATAAVFILLIGVFVPETKGKKDADEVWGRSLSRRID